MVAGESARLRAQKANDAAAHLRRKADHAERAARRWEQGQIGEELLSDLLEPLGLRGFRQLPDRGIPGRSSNIDLLVVGPPGVLVLDAKNWSGTVQTDGTLVWQNNRSRAKELESLREQAALVSELLDGRGMGMVPVHAALCFMGTAQLGASREIDRLHLIDGSSVAAFISGLPVSLNEEWIVAATEFLSGALPPRIANGDEEETPPPEPVVFLSPWFKFGKRRIYVRDELGIDGGYLDLQTASVVGTSKSAESVLRQLLPAFAEGQSTDELTDTDRGAIRKFLSSLRGNSRRNPRGIALVVGYAWRNHGMRRLYVHRLDPSGAKVELGWFDIDDGLACAVVQGSEPVIRFCGRRYRELLAGLESTS